MYSSFPFYFCIGTPKLKTGLKDIRCLTFERFCVNALIMKKRFITLVIVAITISLVGLVGIQLYWISNAVAVKEANFEQGVSEAASRAIYKFNKQELARKVMRQRERSQNLHQLSHMLDSLNRAYYNRIISRESGENYRYGDRPESMQQELNVQLREEQMMGQMVKPIDTSMVLPDDEQPHIDGGYLPDNDPLQEQDPLHAFFDRSKIISDLLNDLFSGNYTFQHSDEESVANLDSLINQELQSQGIKTTYEFGVYNPARHTLIQEKTGTYTEDLLESRFAYHLFPNDIFVNPEYLLLHFPQQESYILAQMGFMLSTSIILILVIISSFAFTIFTIIRQKKLSVMKNDFINNMTHELKTPISTISLACQALSDQDVQKSENLYQSYINVINEENERLGLLTEKVLQTALIEKARIRLNKTTLDLHTLIENAIEKIGLAVKEKDGQIITRLNATQSSVKADKVHMTNVFSNLLDNANKYSPHSPHITVITENTSDGVLVHVKDKGIGISRVNQKKIFDNLYRISTGNIHDIKGFGLGLSYVKAIVEKHGGNVSLESEPNKGSRFTVYIPFGYNGESPPKQS